MVRPCGFTVSLRGKQVAIRKCEGIAFGVIEAKQANRQKTIRLFDNDEIQQNIAHEILHGESCNRRAYAAVLFSAIRSNRDESYRATCQP
jgi:hypothetical protein